MAKVKRVIELSVKEKKFLDNFFGMLYDEFYKYGDDEIGAIVQDVYNLCLSENDPFPQTYVGDLIEVRVMEEK